MIATRDAGSALAVAQVVRLLGGQVTRSLPIINGCAATLPNFALRLVAILPYVQHIANDRLVIVSNERTGATVGATAIRQTLGLDGAGVGVAVIDSGISAWHDDLADASQAIQRVDRFVDFVGTAALPSDHNGHGTHVAGIVAGNGFDSNGARTGIAPASHLIALKVLDGAGRGRISNVIAAMDYVKDHSAELNIRVVNLSVGAAVVESYDVDPLALAAKQLVIRGIVVVAAAGNGGRDEQGHTQYGAIAAPGNAPWVLTVGASSHLGTTDRADDTIAGFSSRGPTPVNRTAKPDIVAPGVGIESLSVPNSSLYQSRAAGLLSGTSETVPFPYLSLSGTSQSAPVVTGTVALMLQANPALTPNAVKAILQYTAESGGAYNALTQGGGFLNAYGAVELARYLASPETMPTPDTNGWAGQLIWGNHRVGGGHLTPIANAWLSDVEWGQARTPTGENVTWGVICTAQDCADPLQWGSWQTDCVDASCATVTWGSGISENVVWGPWCGGADCLAGQVWGVHLLPEGPAGTDDGDTVVWGTLDDDTVVWGTLDDDTVVWGTQDEDTVVWGTDGDDDDTVVWGTTTCEPATCEGVDQP